MADPQEVQTKVLHCDIPLALHTRMRIAAVELQLNTSQIIKAALEKFLPPAPKRRRGGGRG